MENDIRKSISMWGNTRVDEFEIDIGDGWELFLGKKFSFPVSTGKTYYYGRLSKDLSGLELRKDRDFLSAKPLYVLRDDPHPKLLTLWSNVKQVTASRFICTGCAPASLYSRRREDESNSFDDDEEEEEEDEDDDQYGGVSTEKLQVKLPDGKMAKAPDCMFLGMPSSQRADLRLKAMIPECLYSVHKSMDDSKVGYLFTVGIQSPDLETFHSDEGFYEVGVTVPLDGSNDFIALLGSQNSLNWYELDDVRLLDRVHVDDLALFDRYAEIYRKPPPPPKYSTLKKSHSSMGTWLDAGNYLIVGCKFKRDARRGITWSTEKNVRGSTCNEIGEDNEGRRYSFPNKGFEVRKVKAEGEYTIYLPVGGFALFWDGNLLIKTKGGGIFRLYTNLLSIEGGPHFGGDMSEYDQDSDKTLKKLELAIKKASDEYMKLPNESPLAITATAPPTEQSK